MPYFWDAFLDHIGTEVQDLAPRELLKRFFEYLQAQGFKEA